MAKDIFSVPAFSVDVERFFKKRFLGMYNEIRSLKYEIFKYLMLSIPGQKICNCPILDDFSLHRL